MFRWCFYTVKFMLCTAEGFLLSGIGERLPERWQSPQMGIFAFISMIYHGDLPLSEACSFPRFKPRSGIGLVCYSGDNRRTRKPPGLPEDATVNITDALYLRRSNPIPRKLVPSPWT